MSESKILASENSHWYDREGKPVYEVPCTTKEGMRPTNIKDARKLDLVPSFSLIKDQVAKPGLEVWKLNQVLSSALKLDRLPNEPLEDFSRRAIDDYKQEGERVRERGKELHAAFEIFVGNTQLPDRKWARHLEKIHLKLLAFGIDIGFGDWRAEHSFASELGYGGKTDAAHDSGVIIDLKTKDRIDDKKQLVWDEHPMQCAAYGNGIFSGKIVSVPVKEPAPQFKFRGINVFVGVDDCEVRVFEHEWEDLTRGWEMFKALLRYWQIKNNWKT